MGKVPMCKEEVNLGTWVIIANILWFAKISQNYYMEGLLTHVKSKKKIK